MRAAIASWVLGTSLILATAVPAAAQSQTVGLFVNDEQAFEGYTLFGPHNSTSVFLISNDGLLVHEWETPYEPSLMGYLLESGHLIRKASVPGVPGGVLQEFDWDGILVWEYTMDIPRRKMHHDIEPLPNGNVLVIAWETKSDDAAIAAGRDPSTVIYELDPDMIAEVSPDGEIVWEWHIWDHLVQNFDPTKDNFGVVTDHPELIDINFGDTHGGVNSDWNHANGIDYNAQLDQIVLSVRNFSEFWVIDHSTTTEEAAGHTGGNSGKGGDLLYRWGNPQAYGRGTAADRRLYFQHDAQWIPPGYPGEGNFIVFNNGEGRPDGDYSSIEEIVSPVDEFGAYSIEPGVPFGPDRAVWSYTSTPPENFYSPFISGVERQSGGTTLICSGRSGHFFEVTPDGTVVWDYVNPVFQDGRVTQGDPVPTTNQVFKIRRYPPDYPAFAGKDLTPGGPLESFNPPLPVPNGSLLASKLDATGDQIRVQWDASSCTSANYNILFGNLEDVATYGLLGGECQIGIVGGTYDWLDVPEENLFFLVVGTDETGIYESSWREDSFGEYRNGGKASFQ
jgi:hypothetical protein